MREDRQAVLPERDEYGVVDLDDTARFRAGGPPYCC